MTATSKIACLGLVLSCGGALASFANGCSASSPSGPPPANDGGTSSDTAAPPDGGVAEAASEAGDAPSGSAPEGKLVLVKGTGDLVIASTPTPGTWSTKLLVTASTGDAGANTVLSASISADGATVAYIKESAGNTSVRLVNADGSNDHEVVTCAGNCPEAVFGADGKIWYRESNGSAMDLKSVAATGGTPNLWTTVVNRCGVQGMWPSYDRTSLVVVVRIGPDVNCTPTDEGVYIVTLGGTLGTPRKPTDAALSTDLGDIVAATTDSSGALVVSTKKTGGGMVVASLKADGSIAKTLFDDAQVAPGPFVFQNAGAYVTVARSAGADGGTPTSILAYDTTGAEPVTPLFDVSDVVRSLSWAR